MMRSLIIIVSCWILLLLIFFFFSQTFFPIILIIRSVTVIIYYIELLRTFIEILNYNNFIIVVCREQSERYARRWIVRYALSSNDRSSIDDDNYVLLRVVAVFLLLFFRPHGCCFIGFSITPFNYV